MGHMQAFVHLLALVVKVLPIVTHPDLLKIRNVGGVKCHNSCNYAIQFLWTTKLNKGMNHSKLCFSQWKITLLTFSRLFSFKVKSCFNRSVYKHTHRCTHRQKGTLDHTFSWAQPLPSTRQIFGQERSPLLCVHTAYMCVAGQFFSGEAKWRRVIGWRMVRFIKVTVSKGTHFSLAEGSHAPATYSSKPTWEREERGEEKDRWRQRKRVRNKHEAESP